MDEKTKAHLESRISEMLTQDLKEHREYVKWVVKWGASALMVAALVIAGGVTMLVQGGIKDAASTLIEKENIKDAVILRAEDVIDARAIELERNFTQTAEKFLEYDAENAVADAVKRRIAAIGDTDLTEQLSAALNRGPQLEAEIYQVGGTRAFLTFPNWDICWVTSESPTLG